MNTQVQVKAVKVLPYDGNAQAAKARSMAAKAGPLSEVIEKVEAANVVKAGGAVNTMVMLRHIYGADLDSMPKPGEKEGNNRDEITIEETVDGETKSRDTTFYVVFADNTPLGASILSRLAQCERAKKTDTVKDDIPADILEMVDNRTIKREIDRLEALRSTNRALIKRAMKLVHQFNAIETVPGVLADPIWADGKEGKEVLNVKDCIQVWQMHEDEKRGVKYSRDFNISTFLKLDTKAAIEAGGGFKALIDTLARETKKGGQNTTAPDRRIASLDTMVGVTVELHRFTDEIILDKDKAEYEKLIKALKSAKAADETVASFVELRNYLTDIIDAAGLQERYNKLQQIAA